VIHTPELHIAINRMIDNISFYRNNPNTPHDSVQSRHEIGDQHQGSNLDSSKDISEKGFECN
jgi:hypothetical protein